MYDFDNIYNVLGTEGKLVVQPNFMDSHIFLSEKLG